MVSYEKEDHKTIVWVASELPRPIINSRIIFKNF
jgi:hypothetical protein